MTIFVICLVIGFVVGMLILRKMRKTTKKVTAKDEVDLTLSWAAREVLKHYNGLPEQHRPSLDVEAAVRALDTKYGLDEVNNHFEEDYRHWHSTTNHSFECWCVRRYDWNDEPVDSPSEVCFQYPEYKTLIDEMGRIKSALWSQEQAQLERDKVLVLAGIEGDLRSVDAITEALRAERDLIVEVTNEIESGTRILR